MRTAQTGRTHGCTDPASNVQKTLANAQPMVWTPRLMGGGISERQLRSRRNAMQIVRIGLDLAKYVFEVHGVDCHGKAVLRKTLRRDVYPASSQTCRLAKLVWKPRMVRTIGQRCSPSSAMRCA